MKTRRLLSLALVLGLVMVWPGPAPAQQTPSGEESQASEESQATGVYRDFSDILLPRELVVERDKSFIYDTASLTAGVLYLNGRVEVKSLTNFFAQSMVTDNWVLAARFLTPKVVLLFEKTNKRAIITITETTFTTHCEIWVAPFLGSVK